MGPDLFGQTFACTCGRTHTVQPRRAIVANSAHEHLPEVLAELTDGRCATVLVDARTRAVGGDQALAALAGAGWDAELVEVPDPPETGSPVCDDATREALDSRISGGDALVAVGAGVLSDLAKWIAFDRGLPYVCLATAASMNGYASANVAPTLAGIKSLIRARPPAAVLASLPTLCRAPAELTAAGLGDILAKHVSGADWHMNHLLFGDDYCERSVHLIAELEPLYMAHPERVRDREPEAVHALFRGLLLTGVAMTLAETSSPASGGEHMVSHALDAMSALDGTPHDLHGRQVGVGTVLASELYRRVLAIESPLWQAPPAEVDRPFWGRLADSVTGRYGTKRPRLAAARTALSQPGAWDGLREALAPRVRAPQTIHDCLSCAGAAHDAASIGCDRPRLLAALQHAHEMRGRFTILDLAHLVGVLPDRAVEIVETWA